MWRIEICRTIDAIKIFLKKTFTYLPTLLFSTYVTPTPPFFFLGLININLVQLSQAQSNRGHQPFSVPAVTGFIFAFSMKQQCWSTKKEMKLDLYVQVTSMTICRFC